MNADLIVFDDGTDFELQESYAAWQLRQHPVEPAPLTLSWDDEELVSA